ncbi:Heterokaryon incompatibility protein 6, OR allele [Fulvia fulva]|uniref:Heterokaryon incompatibility protein 6, OR allele n=1 Tax=Passalora fulva TaxID=5499 RepID=A0A9Q8LCX1_PASFU|nr:Heterokaryon incompatibility protein 6, OR allele [Fulvia fulva]KAK4629368.1 Heterokaryon incompatibility protein 6, OR allele [Fulvia fulva]KAK4630343.1 Heterokaryon incompatibility protein 6, OR allele [Fulvia fulva]UJO15064.1 Heterokaryon incompatibility protein 6, OR allele [Fulvia fulva]WPV12209.1 Heterokaryon incompatibility protein 6, OR allele [Fulvia fulva]WPV26970.1 Heterokaryon incompatibility protein 6, OR allele [Fulvia fulva]
MDEDQTLLPDEITSDTEEVAVETNSDIELEGYARSQESTNLVNTDAPEAYTGLDISRDVGLDGRCFRLLRLKPGRFEDVLRCDLTRRPIYAAGRYVAVSYSWTNQPASETLLVGIRSDQLAITAHLAAALRRLRNTHSPVSVWIDAICIDQSSLEDRACQVEVMHEIFGGAADVRVWLGEDDPLTGEPATDTMVLLRLCRSPAPWWSRLWVLQECAYAQQCSKVMVGGQILDKREFICAWKNCVMYVEDKVTASILEAHLRLAQQLLDAYRNQNRQDVIEAVYLIDYVKQPAEIAVYRTIECTPCSI